MAVLRIEEDNVKSVDKTNAGWDRRYFTRGGKPSRSMVRLRVICSTYAVCQRRLIELKDHWLQHCVAAVGDLRS
jgi:hypothetical protein